MLMASFVLEFYPLSTFISADFQAIGTVDMCYISLGTIFFVYSNI